MAAQPSRWMAASTGPSRTINPPRSSITGQNFVDVVSYDNYRSLDDRYYWEILDLANGKPIALGEVGSPPPAEVLKSQPKWVWFMDWADGVQWQADKLKTAYANPWVISRGDLPALFEKQ